MKLLTILILGYILWRIIRKSLLGSKSSSNYNFHPDIPAQNDSQIEDAQFRDIDDPQT